MGRLITKSTSFTRPANTAAYAAGDNVAPVPLTITGASNAEPIVITSNGHGLTTGDFVTVASVGGNTAANGSWYVTRIDANTFSLDGSEGNGSYTSGGTATRLLRLADILPANYRRGLIIFTRLETNNPTITNGTFRIYFLKEPFAQIADNAAWTLLTANKAKRAAKSADLTLATEGSGSDSSEAQDAQSVIPFEVAEGVTDLFLVLVAEGDYTPASGQVFFIEVAVEVPTGN